MASIKVPFFVAKQSAGKSLYYWQPSPALRARGFRPERLPESLPDALRRAGELNAKALGLEPASPTAMQGTVRALIKGYKASDHFRKLAPATRRGYDQALTRIDAWMGDERVTAITPGLVHKLYLAKRKTAPVFAHLVVRVGRRLWSAGRLLELTGSTNPWASQSLTSPPRTGLVWPREAVDAFVRAADAMGMHSLGTAVAINEWLGQREADLLRIPRAIVASGEIPLRQQKTGTHVRLPIGNIPHLAARLDQELERQRKRQVVSTSLIVSEATGTPYKADHFRHHFAAVRATAAAGDAKLGIEPTPKFDVDFLVPGKRETDADAYSVKFSQLKFRHLRHTAVVRMAEAGIDIVLIAAVTGHAETSVDQIMKHYAVKTGRMAAEAFRRRLAHESAAVVAIKDAKKGDAG